MQSNNYTSTCDTTNGTMLFEFSGGVSATLNDHYAIFLDQRRKVAKKLRNGEVMEQFSTEGMGLGEFEQILENFEKGLLPPRPTATPPVEGKEPPRPTGTPTSATLSAPPTEGNAGARRAIG